MVPARFLSAALLALALGAPAAWAALARDARALMGTVVEVIAEGADQASVNRAVHDAYAEMGRLAGMMSHYDPRSALSAINHAAGRHAVAVPPELMEVLVLARRMSERTGGAFDVTAGALVGWRFRPDDPRIPGAAELASQLAMVDYRKLRLDPRNGSTFLELPGMRIDPGGIAKLYILEAGRRAAEARGATRALVNGGGDVVAHGGDAGRPWRIGVRDPREPAALLGTLEIRRGAIASSGDYERSFVHEGTRYHHVLDPRTGYPTRGVRGVTLLAEEPSAVNGLGVAIMVLGPAAGQALIARTRGVEGLIVDADGAVWMSEGFQARLKR